MTDEHKQDFWQRHINNWSQSQLTQKAYCQQNDITFASFGYWRTRLNRTVKTGNKLIPINLSPRAESIDVFLPGGLRLAVPVHTLADVLPIVYSTIGAQPE